jgi:hypothetical protein
MMRAAAIGVLVVVAGCGDHAAPAVSDDAVATAAAERKAVADTDGARRDASVAGRTAEQN